MSRQSDRNGIAIALVIVTSMAGSAGCLPPQFPEPVHLALPSRVAVRTASGVVRVPLEEYVLGSALAEISPLDETPATVARVFEVQAIVARTYVAGHVSRHRGEGFDVCDTTHCQLYDSRRLATSRFAAAARAAVARTTGTVLVFDGRPAEALFHADCGGYTAAADTVWGGPPAPYLLARPDQVPASAHRSWQFTVPAARLREAFNVDPSSDVGRRLDDVRVAARDASGRATSVELRGERTHITRGEQLRTLINRAFGDKALQSTRLRITHQGDSFTFDGTGFGHGVGLCQVGAMARARRGETLNTILTHYFAGVRIVQIR
jgi:stage II sporulation protein D (peptidoglycan lytic transglycosylase)